MIGNTSYLIVMAKFQRKVKHHLRFCELNCLFTYNSQSLTSIKFQIIQQKIRSASVIALFFFSFQYKLYLTICVLFLLTECLVESRQIPSENQSTLLHRQKRSKEIVEKIKKVGSILFKCQLITI